ncbi:unnamed protein product [Notodromas monacha]|uniref:Cystinosin n=1 Tax=Notodromas monacha TaxID=399045 RepID=A0A7R9GI83_9CRUS|nr:unnamed protein product [Notodromas monacha]CAG0923592.1 unnamed protein product [Notodromas monacha]
MDKILVRCLCILTLIVISIIEFSGAVGGLTKSAKVTIEPSYLSLLLGSTGSLKIRVVSNFTGTISWAPTGANVVAVSPTSLVYSVVGKEETATVSVTAIGPGETGLVFDPSGLLPRRMEDVAVSVVVYKSSAVSILAQVVGWVYFLAWSISFYPQIYCNWRRKSVVGLSLDFVSLNLLGFLCYTVFNIAMLYVGSVREEFLSENPGSIVQVDVNDVAFASHALLACLVTSIQCMVYERGNQRISALALILLSMLVTFAAVVTIMAIAALFSWLMYVVLLSYVKLIITCIKYIPQAVMNFKRKSTAGWSIGNILLDLTGGLFSFLQMVLMSYNRDAWASIWGNPTKLGLSFLSIAFDFIFMFQHYVLYRNAESSFAVDDDVQYSPTIEDALFGRCSPVRSYGSTEPTPATSTTDRTSS